MSAYELRKTANGETRLEVKGFAALVERRGLTIEDGQLTCTKCGKKYAESPTDETECACGEPFVVDGDEQEGGDQ